MIAHLKSSDLPASNLNDTYTHKPTSFLSLLS